MCYHLSEDREGEKMRISTPIVSYFVILFENFSYCPMLEGHIFVTETFMFETVIFS